jgi:isoleucyl-tRNA synthetase
MQIDGESIELLPEDVEIVPVDIPGWKVVNDGGLTVALDIHINESLRLEGIAREMVNRLQNLRKDSGLEVTDRIAVRIQQCGILGHAVERNSEYIRAQILADTIELVEQLNDGLEVEIEEGMITKIHLSKLN